MAEIMSNLGSISLGHRHWYWQEIDRQDGVLEEFDLYDENGNYSGSFKSYEDMIEFIKGE